TYTGLQKFVTPRALEIGEIPGIVRDYAEGAKRAKAAGFDGVEVHAANGYLIDQFLRDGSNQRTDAYGGSVENRTRFLREVTEAVVGVWGADKVGVRISPVNPFNDMRDSDPHKVFGHAAAILNELKVVYLHVVEPSETTNPKGRVSTVIRTNYRGALIANGGYDLKAGNAAIASGAADMVSFGVLFLANPDLPVRFQRGGTQLNVPQQATFYGGDARGYTDYPELAGL